MNLSYSLKILPVIIIALLASIWLRVNTITTELTILEKGFLGLSKTINNYFEFPYSNLTLSNGITYSIINFFDHSFGQVFTRITIIFFGLLSVFIFYLISKKINDDYLSSLFSAALFSIQSSAIFFGKIINPIVFSLIFFLLFLLFFFSIKNGKKTYALNSILAAIFLFLGILTNYFLVLIIPFLIILTFFQFRNYSLTTLLGVLFVVIYYSTFFQNINNQIMGYFSGRDMFSIGFMSHFLKTLQELSIPLILLIMVQLNRIFLFSQSSKILLLILWLLAIPFIVLSFIFAKIDIISSNIIFSVAILLIPVGAILKDFYIKSFNSRIAVIILYIFSIVLSVYQLGQKISEMKFF